MPSQFHHLQSLLPETTQTLNIGSNELEWLEAFLANLTVTNRATVPTPSAATDAATKGYVDSLFSPTVATIEEADGSPSVTNPNTLRFDQADGFVLSEPSTGVVRVDLTNIPNAVLANSSITITTSGGVTGGGTVSLGGTVNIAGGVPSGAIVMIASGTCADLGTGWSEYTGARGRFLVGVPASGTLAGTAGSAMANLANPSVTPTFTGGGDTTSSVSAGTPAGTVSQPTFTGSALATHAHETGMNTAGAANSISLGSPYGTGANANIGEYVTYTGGATNAAAYLTEAESAGTPAGTVSQPTFTGSALGTHNHTVTATGTNSAVASNSLAPYIQLMFCQRT